MHAIQDFAHDLIIERFCTSMFLQASLHYLAHFVSIPISAGKTNDMQFLRQLICDCQLIKCRHQLSSRQISGSTKDDQANGNVRFLDNRKWQVAHVLGLLYRVTTELIAQGGQDLGRITFILTTCKALHQGKSDHWGGYVLINSFKHGPAALSGIGHPPLDIAEGLVFLEGKCQQVEQPGPNHGAVLPNL